MTTTLPPSSMLRSEPPKLPARTESCSGLFDPVGYVAPITQEMGKVLENTSVQVLIAERIGPLFYRRWFFHDLLTESWLGKSEQLG